MDPKPLITVIAGAAALLTLAGCSASPDPKATTEPKTTPTAPMAAKDVRTPDAKADVACTDGKATVEQSNHEVTLAGACASVVVSANNAIVHLGDVKELTVTGGLTRVIVDTADTVIVSGSGNDVLWQVEKPVNVDDRGEQNFVQKAAKG